MTTTYFCFYLYTADPLETKDGIVEKEPQRLYGKWQSFPEDLKRKYLKNTCEQLGVGFKEIKKIEERHFEIPLDGFNHADPEKDVFHKSYFYLPNPYTHNLIETWEFVKPCRPSL